MHGDDVEHNFLSPSYTPINHKTDTKQTTEQHKSMLSAINYLNVETGPQGERGAEKYKNTEIQKYKNTKVVFMCVTFSGGSREETTWDKQR